MTFYIYIFLSCESVELSLFIKIVYNASIKEEKYVEANRKCRCCCFFSTGKWLSGTRDWSSVRTVRNCVKRGKSCDECNNEKFMWKAVSFSEFEPHLNHFYSCNIVGFSWIFVCLRTNFRNLRLFFSLSRCSYIYIVFDYISNDLFQCNSTQNHKFCDQLFINCTNRFLVSTSIRFRVNLQGHKISQIIYSSK